MDKNRFDGFTRQLAKRENRRTAIKTLFAGGVGTAATVLVGGETDAAKTDCCPADHPTLCGLTCTDTITSVTDCGGCGLTCGANERCYKGACESTSVEHCTTVADCSATSTECSTVTCKKSTCGVTYAASGKKVTTQTAGDCQKNVCDGAGHVISIVDNTDKPAASGECTTGVCVDGVPHQNARPSGRNCTNGKCNGAGICVPTGGCTSASTCPGTDTECATRTCTNGVCGMSFEPNGTATASQIAGNCQKTVCNGAGQIIPIVDNTNTPPADDCIIGECDNGIPRTFSAPAGTVCPEGVCNDAGHCVECVLPADCPGADLDCSTRACTDGVCGRTNLPSGAVTANQIEGDCKIRICDGSGFSVDIVDASDLPAQGLPCSHGICSNGEAIVTHEDRGVSCPGGYCDGAGVCAECLDASHCAASPNECSSPICSNGVCGLAFVANGVVTTNQTIGDCQQNVCDGAGNIVSVADNTDFWPPYYDQPCNDSVCIDGVPSRPPYPARTPCLGTSGICDGAGTCVDCLGSSDCPDSGIDNAETICIGGYCQYQCIAGYTDCHPYGAGCVDTDIHPSHCGACGHVCSAQNGNVICANGACALIGCNPGFDNCNGNPADGCETDITSDPDNCGVCGNVCASGSCQNSICV